MRLSNFVIDTHNLNEGYAPVKIDILKDIFADCSDIMKIYYHTWPNCLRRASEKSFSFKKVTPRTNRKPLDTNPEIHDAMDKVFKELFGWNVRSEGVFTTANLGYVHQFGPYRYIIFPMNGFKYVYNKRGEDTIYPYIHNVMYDHGVTRETVDILKDLVKRDYVTTGIEKAIMDEEDVEIVIKCDRYYALFDSGWNRDIVEEYLETIWREGK
jgi:hypothetical protein